MALRLFHLTCSFLFLLLLVMVTFTVGPHVEAWLRPVVDEVYITVEERNEDGLTILLSYTKHRDCEWMGVGWYFGQTRLLIDFREERMFMPRSRLPGEHLVGPWTIQNINMLEGTRAEIYHRCHPFWQVHNTLYPPKETWDRREHVELFEGAWAPYRFVKGMRVQ